MALRNFTLLTLACHSEEESKYLRACQNHTKKTWIFQAPVAPEAPAMKKLLFCWMRKDADVGSVDATWRISSSSLRMCARQDCFVFERPQVVFYCNFSCSRHVSKSANLIGRIVFDAARQTKKTNPRRLKINDAFKWCLLKIKLIAAIWKKRKWKIILEANGYRQLFGYQHSSKYLLLCSTEERNSCKFETTRGWVNYYLNFRPFNYYYNII